MTIRITEFDFDPQAMTSDPVLEIVGFERSLWGKKRFVMVATDNRLIVRRGLNTQLMPLDAIHRMDYGTREHLWALVAGLASIAAGVALGVFGNTVGGLVGLGVAAAFLIYYVQTKALVLTVHGQSSITIAFHHLTAHGRRLAVDSLGTFVDHIHILRLDLLAMTDVPPVDLTPLLEFERNRAVPIVDRQALIAASRQQAEAPEPAPVVPPQPFEPVSEVFPQPDATPRISQEFVETAEAVDNDTLASALLHTGAKFYAEARYEEAADAFDQTLVYRPDMTGARDGLAASYLKIGEAYVKANAYRQAIDILGKSVAIRADYPQIHKLLALSYKAVGDHNLAEQHKRAYHTYSEPSE